MFDHAIPNATASAQNAQPFGTLRELPFVVGITSLVDFPQFEQKEALVSS